MPTTNYTTAVPDNRSISEIQDTLVKHGATGLLYKYEQGTGRIEALQFLLQIKKKDVAFSLQAHWRRCQRVLELQQVRRWDEEEYVYRVARHNRRDWSWHSLPSMRLRFGDAASIPNVCDGCEGADAV